MKGLVYGVLAGAVVFGALSWATAKRTVHATVLPAPLAGRFQIVQLHPSSGNEWSGILDTETGCTWVYYSQTVPASAKTPSDLFYAARGSNFFGLEHFDPMDYAPPKKNGGDAGLYNEMTGLIVKEGDLCSRSRINALRAAAAQ